MKSLLDKPERWCRRAEARTIAKNMKEADAKPTMEEFAAFDDHPVSAPRSGQERRLRLCRNREVRDFFTVDNA
jgi:hypothetical protein